MSGRIRPTYREGSPDCDHPNLTRTVVEGAGSVFPDAAVYTCPDCGFSNYGDAGGGWDRRQGSPP